MSEQGVKFLLKKNKKYNHEPVPMLDTFLFKKKNTTMSEQESIFWSGGEN
jgi:hypothetical protein